MTVLAEPTHKKSSFSTQVPSRFQTSRSTLFVDRFMTHFIKAGGIGIIAAVFGIFIFIFTQTVPLFKGASVTYQRSIRLPAGNYLEMGVDEWGQMPFAVDETGKIIFINSETGEILKSYDPGMEMGAEITAFDYNFLQQQMVYGTALGQVFSVKIQYDPLFEGGQRRISVTTETGEAAPVGEAGIPVSQVAQGVADEAKLVAVVQRAGEGYAVHAVKFSRKETLLGTGDFSVTHDYDISSQIEGEPLFLLVNSYADSVVIATDQNKIFYFREAGGELHLKQAFAPFDDLKNSSIHSMNYILGDVSLSVTNAEGVHRIFSLFVPDGGRERLYGMTKEFQALPRGADFFNASLRNKAFVIGSNDFVSLRYSTTETIRWQQEVPFQVDLAVLGRKYNSLFLLDKEQNLHVYEIQDHHPEAGVQAFFGKVWYEGYSEPDYVWQSTGASDDFESKLSLIPLIVGTLKGTLYAMLFALPIAVLAAVYTSQFAHPRFKVFVKPVMEIMASLPSVVLGFLAALWLAPLLEPRVPSILLIFLLLPLSALGAGWLWTSLPIKYRKWIRPGYEWLAMLPVMAVACYGGWILGPVLERTFFVVTDPQTGAQIADFRLWWPHATGTSFQQRNSLVVGFMMAFAVIPIIFTISEDALSNVPKTLVSGSLALGASRWQTAMGVVIPTAFPGIFSATMIGLGRAVGETMIVVMATGNTPVMDWNIFTGMRTLSANIAVELPEAPYLSTLYRTLFLGAVVLFVMTFIVNTFADIIRQHLREKYKTV